MPWIRVPRLVDRCARRLAVAVWLGLSSCNDGGSSGPGPGPGSPVAEVIRGPQIARVTETSVLIAWLSDVAAAGAVQYGDGMGFDEEAAESGRRVEHVITLTGLVPGHLYRYRLVLDGSVASEGHVFTTAAADPTTPLRAAVFGDSGSGTRSQLNVARQVAKSSPDLVLHTGDVIYERGAPGELDPHYFVPYETLIDRIPFYPALGNHDVLSQDGRPLLQALYLPTNSSDGTESYYSFDRGEVHFVALNSNAPLDPGSRQMNWLEDDLGATKALWVLVYFHHPPYSASRHGSSRDLREHLGPVFDEHRVDLVLNGHDHDYERTFPLRNEDVAAAGQDPNYVDPAGTIYIVTGGGGRELYKNGREYFTAFSASVHHHVNIDIDGNRLTGTAIRMDGQVLDRFTITKTPE